MRGEPIQHQTTASKLLPKRNENRIKLHRMRRTNNKVLGQAQQLLIGLPRVNRNKVQTCTFFINYLG